MKAEDSNQTTSSETECKDIEYRGTVNIKYISGHLELVKTNIDRK